MPAPYGGGILRTRGLVARGWKEEHGEGVWVYRLHQSLSLWRVSFVGALVGGVCDAPNYRLRPNGHNAGHH